MMSSRGLWSSAYILYKQFGPRSGSTKWHVVWLCIWKFCFWKRINFGISQQMTTQAWKITCEWALVLIYSKIYLKRPLKKEDQNWFIRQIIVLMEVKSIAEWSINWSILPYFGKWEHSPILWRSNVLQNAPMGAICNTFDPHQATICL